MQILGNNVLVLCKALVLIQSEVSDDIDISRDYISKIESDQGRALVKIL
jgi:hypothetical protein